MIACEPDTNAVRAKAEDNQTAWRQIVPPYTEHTKKQNINVFTQINARFYHAAMYAAVRIDSYVFFPSGHFTSRISFH